MLLSKLLSILSMLLSKQDIQEEVATVIKLVHKLKYLIKRWESGECIYSQCHTKYIITIQIKAK